MWKNSGLPAKLCLVLIQSICFPQLYGGIQRYLEQFPDGGFFRGKNFVFDHRYDHCSSMLPSQALVRFLVSLIHYSYCCDYNLKLILGNISVQNMCLCTLSQRR